MALDRGIAKTLYKVIKKETGKKVDVISAIEASLNSDMGGLPDIPIVMMWAISEHDMWFIQKNSVQPIPLKYLEPLFPKPYEFLSGSHIFSIPEEFVFRFLPNDKLMRIRPIENTPMVKDFTAWMTMLTERDQLEWWK